MFRIVRREVRELASNAPEPEQQFPAYIDQLTEDFFLVPGTIAAAQ